jgi:hypothetical protein
MSELLESILGPGTISELLEGILGPFCTSSSEFKTLKWGRGKSILQKQVLIELIVLEHPSSSKSHLHHRLQRAIVNRHLPGYHEGWMASGQERVFRCVSGPWITMVVSSVPCVRYLSAPFQGFIHGVFKNLEEKIRSMVTERGRWV